MDLLHLSNPALYTLLGVAGRGQHRTTRAVTTDATDGSLRAIRKVKVLDRKHCALFVLRGEYRPPGAGQRHVPVTFMTFSSYTLHSGGSTALQGLWHVKDKDVPSGARVFPPILRQYLSMQADVVRVLEEVALRGDILVLAGSSGGCGLCQMVLAHLYLAKDHPPFRRLHASALLVGGARMFTEALARPLDAAPRLQVLRVQTRNDPVPDQPAVPFRHLGRVLHVEKGEGGVLCPANRDLALPGGATKSLQLAVGFVLPGLALACCLTGHLVSGLIVVLITAALFGVMMGHHQMYHVHFPRAARGEAWAGRIRMTEVTSQELQGTPWCSNGDSPLLMVGVGAVLCVAGLTLWAGQQVPWAACSMAIAGCLLLGGGGSDWIVANSTAAA